MSGPVSSVVAGVSPAALRLEVVKDCSRHGCLYRRDHPTGLQLAARQDQSIPSAGKMPTPVYSDFFNKRARARSSWRRSASV